jgi:peptide-methionine (S)-S-oxide reductase
VFGIAHPKAELIARERALPGRATPIVVPGAHFVNGRPLAGPHPAGTRSAWFGLGCFWGAERRFWTLPGVHVTAVGYQGGFTPNPTYEEVCSGATGHAETVQVVYDPAAIAYRFLLGQFFEAHDPTQGMRQGNDVGTQYRSAIYCADEAERAVAEALRASYSEALVAKGLKPATTEIALAPPFYFAEDYHQQYLAKNPAGYCGLGGTGVSCSI